MLFRALDTFLLSHVNTRVTPHLDTYIETLNVRRGILTERYETSPGYESNIVVLLRKILADADIPSLLVKSSDLDCYYDTLVYTTPSLNSIFDAVTTGLSFYDMAIRRSEIHTEEFFIPVQCRDPVATLPFDQGWDAWQSVRPLRLVDIDSLELTSATYQDQIVFTKLHPTRAVMTIDVVALVLQYVNFLRSNTQVMDQPEYLHHYVLVSLLKDLDDLWLGNVYTAMLAAPAWSTKNPSENITKQLIGDGFYGYKGTELPTALRELANMITACRNGSVTPAVLVASLPLTSCCVPDFIKQLIATTSTDDRRQTYWMEFLRDYRWLELLYQAYQLQPNFVASKNLYTSLRRDIPLIFNKRFWNNCRNQKVSNFIQTELQELLRRCS